MARRSINKLTAAMVKQATKPGYHSDGRGLVLQVSRSGSKSWLFRYRSPTGKIREMGLGSALSISLADARRKADQAQRQRDDGQDPIAVKRDSERLAELEAAKGVNFKWCAEQYLATNAAGWQNAKHEAQWSATLKAYAYPHFGNLAVAAVDTALVTKALEPIWSSKTETASRVRQRVERVLSWAIVRGYRTGPNPAAWRGHLDHILPKPSKVRSVVHHKALPIDMVPGLWRDLCLHEAVSAFALRFLLLTAARTSEVLKSTWAELDLDQKLWIIPKERMKAGKEHRVPLSRTVIKLLQEVKKISDGDLVFPGHKARKPLSDMAMLTLLRRMKRDDVVPHGLRSSFRTWAAERTNYPREVCEQALAHTISNAVEAAYQRGDLLERRRQLMADWASFVTK